MTNFDIVSDISVLTTAPEKTLRNLCLKGSECICHDVLESLQASEIETVVDIGIGTIKIIVDNDEIHYKFTPSNQLEAMLINTIQNNHDPLVTDIEDKLYSRIINTYKDLI